jgi:predicted phosphodiesterase
MNYDIFLESFRQFLADCPEENLDEHSKYVFLSDLHMGNGTTRDDLERNRELIETMLERWYLDRDYVLILNGDVEDLNKFSLGAIRTAWPKLLGLIDQFAKRGHLRKIIGNHDYDLLLEKDYPWTLYPGIIYRVGDKRLFVFHGHQASSLYVKFDYISEFLVRYFVKPLRIKNSGVSQDSRRRFRTEKKIYRAARILGVVAITGHTHRPLFESLSKYDNIRLTIEDLIRRYIDAEPRQKESLEKQICMYRDELRDLASAKDKVKKTQSLYGADPFIIPCIFNSGCATGSHGITVLEIDNGKISLEYWTTGARVGPYITSEAIDYETLVNGIFRYTLHRERLDGVFSRIDLLGETNNDLKP